MDDAVTALNLGFGREPLAAFAAWFVEKSWCSRQSLLPDGFARHITEVSCFVHISALVVSAVRNRRMRGGLGMRVIRVYQRWHAPLALPILFPPGLPRRSST